MSRTSFAENTVVRGPFFIPSTKDPKNSLNADAGPVVNSLWEELFGKHLKQDTGKSRFFGFKGLIWENRLDRIRKCSSFSFLLRSNLFD